MGNLDGGCTGREHCDSIGKMRGVTKSPLVSYSRGRNGLLCKTETVVAGEHQQDRRGASAEKAPEPASHGVSVLLRRSPRLNTITAGRSTPTSQIPTHGDAATTPIGERVHRLWSPGGHWCIGHADTKLLRPLWRRGERRPRRPLCLRLLHGPNLWQCLRTGINTLIPKYIHCDFVRTTLHGMAQHFFTHVQCFVNPCDRWTPSHWRTIWTSTRKSTGGSSDLWFNKGMLRLQPATRRHCVSTNSKMIWQLLAHGSRGQKES